MRPEQATFRLEYESSPGVVTVWEKTAAELLVPNGSEHTLLDWMLTEVVARGGQTFKLELLPAE